MAGGTRPHRSGRHRHPFANCTGCGPRYTIVQSVPYDRATTAMASFAMCESCWREYEDASDRRFHAQPVACPDCGPTLRFGSERGEAALQSAISEIASGRVVAVKGMGGYHLAVDATNTDAVAELRRRKARDDKPFAVMVSGLDEARALCELDDATASMLASPRAPIVVAPARARAQIAPGVSPGRREIGVLLAYTPLHRLLLEGVGRPLVMTSGNLSEEPIAHEDGDAVDRLGSLADGFLTHDRRIHIRCEDSVVRRMPESGGFQVVRRSRGYVPEPLRLPVPTARPVLAVGAELKNTVSIAFSDAVVASHHIGDLEHLAAYESFLQAVDHLPRLCGVVPEVVAHDLHPEYLSTKYAIDLDVPAIAVQHHHAHIASCMVEHHRSAPVLGLAFDGTGYGCDGAVWGGEFLVADLTSATRVGRLRPVTLPGGSAAVREPWRMAVAWGARTGAALDPRGPAVLDLVRRGAGLQTTSMGRLFDAAAAVLGCRPVVTYEAQAAIELETLAAAIPIDGALDLSSLVACDGRELDPSALVAALVDRYEGGEPADLLAAAFHESMGLAVAHLASALASDHGLDTVALSGGVFQNDRLTAVVTRSLEARGLEVLRHHSIPCNDGGISIGQAAVAAAVEVATGAPEYRSAFKA